jgi:hypothetical protein
MSESCLEIEVTLIITLRGGAGESATRHGEEVSVGRAEPRYLSCDGPVKGQVQALQVVRMTLSFPGVGQQPKITLRHP